MRRWLGDHRHALAYLVLACAVILSLYRVETLARENRQTLVRFVCAAVEVAREQQTPEALRRAERFEEILASIGEGCPLPKGAS